jgi:hypothetical protein
MVQRGSATQAAVDAVGTAAVRCRSGGFELTVSEWLQRHRVGTGIATEAHIPIAHVSSLFTVGDTPWYGSRCAIRPRCSRSSVPGGSALDLDEDLLPMTGNRARRTWPSMPDAGASGARNN